MSLVDAVSLETVSTKAPSSLALLSVCSFPSLCAVCWLCQQLDKWWSVPGSGDVQWNNQHTEQKRRGKSEDWAAGGLPLPDMVHLLEPFKVLVQLSSFEGKHD